MTSHLHITADEIRTTLPGPFPPRAFKGSRGWIVTAPDREPSRPCSQDVAIELMTGAVDRWIGGGPDARNIGTLKTRTVVKW